MVPGGASDLDLLAGLALNQSTLDVYVMHKATGIALFDYEDSHNHVCSSKQKYFYYQHREYTTEQTIYWESIVHHVLQMFVDTLLLRSPTTTPSVRYQKWIIVIIASTTSILQK